ncbi:hypothetical protein HK405_000555 [Cladochytrium tenue]|nr:hypothetical protein HK405_000555 [Cladochytrium tenue]
MAHWPPSSSSLPSSATPAFQPPPPLSSDSPLASGLLLPARRGSAPETSLATSTYAPQLQPPPLPSSSGASSAQAHLDAASTHVAPAGTVPVRRGGANRVDPEDRARMLAIADRAMALLDALVEDRAGWREELSHRASGTVVYRRSARSAYRAFETATRSAADPTAAVADVAGSSSRARGDSISNGSFSSSDARRGGSTSSAAGVAGSSSLPPSGPPFFMGVGIIKGFEPETVFSLVRSRSLWDTWYLEGEIIEALDADTDLAYMAMKAVARVLAGLRDFSIVERSAVDRRSGAIRLAVASVDTPLVPPRPDMVRADIRLNGWVFEPVLHHDGSVSTRLSYVLQSDGRGGVPHALVNMWLTRRAMVHVTINAYLRRYGAPPVHRSVANAASTAGRRAADPLRVSVQSATAEMHAAAASGGAPLLLSPLLSSHPLDSGFSASPASVASSSVATPSAAVSAPPLSPGGPVPTAGITIPGAAGAPALSYVGGVLVASPPDPRRTRRAGSTTGSSATGSATSPSIAASGRSLTAGTTPRQLGWQHSRGGGGFSPGTAVAGVAPPGEWWWGDDALDAISFASSDPMVEEPLLEDRRLPPSLARWRTSFAASAVLPRHPDAAATAAAVAARNPLVSPHSGSSGGGGGVASGGGGSGAAGWRARPPELAYDEEKVDEGDPYAPPPPGGGLARLRNPSLSSMVSSVKPPAAPPVPMPALPTTAATPRASMDTPYSAAAAAATSAPSRLSLSFSLSTSSSPPSPPLSPSATSRYFRHDPLLPPLSPPAGSVADGGAGGGGRSVAVVMSPTYHHLTRSVGVPAATAAPGGRSVQTAGGLRREVPPR